MTGVQTCALPILKGNEVVLRLTLPSGTPPGGAPIDHFTIYRGTNSGFTLDETHKIADNIRGNYIDNTVENGVMYYYVSTMTDSAGNVSSNHSSEISVMPTAESGLCIRSAGDITAEPDSIITGRENRLRASVFNEGYASASGNVKFEYSIDMSDSWNDIATVPFEAVVGNTETNVEAVYTPDESLAAGTEIRIRASVTKDANTQEIRVIDQNRRYRVLY